MTNTYRDDLEAALARASDLEREIEDLRQRNATLEAFEARHNARRLAAAIERERDEQQRNDDRDRDEARWRGAAEEAASARSEADVVRHWRNGLWIVAAGALSLVVAGMTNSLAIGVASGALLAIGVTYLYVAEARARKRRQKADDE